MTNKRERKRKGNLKSSNKKGSIFKREFKTKEEVKGLNIICKYLLPVAFLIGILVVALGNRDGFFILYHMVMALILLKVYTKRAGVQKDKKQRSKVYKVTKNILGVIVAVVLVFQIFDTLKYGVAMAQIQIKNDGYVTVTSISNGDFEDARLHANEYNKKEDKVYQHVFDGWKYQSRVDITDKIKEEMRDGKVKGLGVQNE